MKMISYNINGARSSVSKGLKQWMQEVDADVLCLQEVRANEQVLSELFADLDYHKFYNSGKRAGYSGTALLSKTKPEWVRFGINGADDEGRVITAKIGDTVFVNAYIPNGTSRLQFKLDFMADFCTYIKQFSSDKLFVLLDSNVALTELDLSHPKENRMRSGYLPEECEAYDALIRTCALADMFRVLHPERRQYSWRSYRSQRIGGNFGWKFRFDYILASQKALDTVKWCEIADDLPYSDHLPVILQSR